MDKPRPFFVAFDDKTCIARGPLADVARQTQAMMAANPQVRVLVFDAATSAQIDVDLRGTPEEVLRSLAIAYPDSMPVGAETGSQKPAPAGPGRPKLGVVAREVTLLPRHWEWLAGQPGGASVALRKLVDQARRDNQNQDSVRQAREAVYRFMAAMAGDLGGFEEAARALFAGERERFETLLAPWPQDVRAHLLHLAGAAFAPAQIGELHGA